MLTLSEALRINEAAKHGKYFVRASYPGFCALCMGRYREYEGVYYDPSKPIGKRVAHKRCYDEGFKFDL